MSRDPWPSRSLSERPPDRPGAAGNTLLNARPADGAPRPCTLDAEVSDFVRMNRGKIRQPGTVEQRYVRLHLIVGRKHAQHCMTVCGDLARDRVTSAESRVKTAQEGLAKLRAGARKEEVDAARAKVGAVTAQINSLEKGLTDATLKASIGGIVTEKLVEIGEVIPPRAPAVVVVDLDHAWADVFVPEPTVPQIKIGQPAMVFTDAGGSGIAGTIAYISPKAEFTPRNVQTAADRSKLVYRIKVSADNREGVLKPGMPVEAELPK